MRAPQINELCEEVMSQSKTPSLIERLRASAPRMPLHSEANTLMNAAADELTRLSAEKAEVEQTYADAMDDAERIEVALRTQLLQAREDAQRMSKASFKLTAKLCALPEIVITDHISRSRVMDEIVQWRRAIDARQAEPQEKPHA